MGLSAWGEEIASCAAAAGKAFYHFAGHLKKSNSGWTDDKISDAAFTLTRGADGAVDILYVDFRKKPISATGEGGIVRLLGTGRTSITVLV